MRESCSDQQLLVKEGNNAMKRTALIVGLVLASLGAGGLSAAPFIRGDVNQDGKINIADPVCGVAFLFAGGTVMCEDALDVNDSNATDIADPIYLLGYLFAGSAPPTAPFPPCGDDPTPDNLSCGSFDPRLCGPSSVQIDPSGILPAAGASGGSVFITGKGFNAPDTQAFLGDNAILNLAVRSDMLLEGRVPPGVEGRKCDLVVSNANGFARVPDAFMYKNDDPTCLNNDELEQIMIANMGKPYCVPSGLHVDDGVFGDLTVEVCPSGCCSCANGIAGCEVFFTGFTAAFDFEQGRADFVLKAVAIVPIHAETFDGSTSIDCLMKCDGRGTASFDFAAEPSEEWPGMYRIVDVSNVVMILGDYWLESLDGKEPCQEIARLFGLLRDEFAEMLAEETEDIVIDDIRDLLVDTYACP
jgi:hypothetical protein